VNTMTDAIDNVLRYTVFEEDQVLTSGQLNEIVQYLDQQDRATRTKLLGVGIVCGLRVMRRDDSVTVTEGAGVTTEGDLLYLEADRTYDRWKPFPATAYPLPGSTFELVRKEAEDPDAKPLGRFGTRPGETLDDMVAVLFTDSTEKDPDLCSGGDCDNLGKWSCHTQRLLVVPKASIGALLETMATPRAASTNLLPVVAQRPIMSTGITSTATLASTYRVACDQTLKDLLAQLKRVYQECGALLPDVLPTNPALIWGARLAKLSAEFAATAIGIQYYYDFLKDLVETYNEFRRLLCEDTTVCCPLNAFPKHLVLGNLQAGVDFTVNRTGRYPSPLVSATHERWLHAKALVRKLDVLIRSFRAPTDGVIKITPSRFEESALEARAIPFYYQIGGGNSIEQVWNFDLTRSGMAAYNYSYNASAYGAQGGAASPFTAQIGSLPFFRIEGHLSKQVDTVVQDLQAEIRTKNLPLAVRAVFLGVDPTKIKVKPPIHYTDLHRFHYLLRQDAVHQLEDVMQVTPGFRQQVVDSVAAETDAAALKATAEEKSAAILAKAATAKAKLNVPFSEYSPAATWGGDLGDTIAAAGQFKSGLGHVLKTDYTTPYDTLIGATHLQWLPWIDSILQTKNNKANDRLLFSQFIARHPGLEHFAGAVRGGTFVLAYDASGAVVADFMLPYYSPETAEEPDNEPALLAPGFKPIDVLKKGLNVLPSLDLAFKAKLDTFRTGLSQDFVRQGEYTTLLKDTYTSILNVFGKAGAGAAAAGGIVANPALGGKVANMTAATAKLDTLSETLKGIRAPAAREAISAEIRKTEGELADSMTDIARVAATGAMDVSPGSDGFNALLAVSNSAARLSDVGAIGKATEGLAASGANAPPAVKAMIGTIYGFLAGRRE